MSGFSSVFELNSHYFQNIFFATVTILNDDECRGMVAERHFYINNPQNPERLRKYSISYCFEVKNENIRQRCKCQMCVTD